MIRLPVVILLFVFVATPAEGAISLSLSAGDSQNGGILMVWVGQEVEIPIFLNQTGSIETNEPNLSSDPLFSFGFLSTVDAGDAEITAFSISSPFLDAGPSNQRLPNTAVELAGLTFSGASGASIQLGSITLRPLRRGNFTLTLSDTDDRVDDFVTNSGAVLDNLIFPSSSGNRALLNISAIPEPSACFVLVLGSSVCAITRRRRFIRR